MKRRLFAMLIALVMMATLLAGCTEEPEKVTYSCAKCGDSATKVISGTADYMEDEQIPLSKCKKVVDGIYSARLCDDCMGPVAEIKPD